MDQDVSLGQLYNVHNKINILYKALVGLTHFLEFSLKSFVRLATDWRVPPTL
jgi:hypothetical protein